MKKFIVVLLIIPILMTGCWNYNELNDLAITTGFAVDYEDGEYKVSVLIANAQKTESSAKEGESQTTVYSGTGKTIIDAIKEVDKKSPKGLYIGHLSVVVVSKEVAEKGIFEMADYLMRSAESRKKFYFVIAKDCKAKEILSIVLPLESFPSHGIATLIETTNETQAVTTVLPYSKFIANVLTEGKNPTLPSIEIIGDVNKGNSSKALEKTDIKSYLKISGMALFKEDRFVTYTDTPDSQVINVLNNGSESLLTSIKSDNDDIGFSISSLKTKTKLIDENTVSITVKGKADIREINSKRNLEDKNVILNIENDLNKHVVTKINNTIDNLKFKYKTDVLSVGNLIYQKYPKLWKERAEHWDDRYFQKMNFKVKTEIKVVSTGSLKQTLKEVQ